MKGLQPKTYIITGDAPLLVFFGLQISKAKSRFPLLLYTTSLYDTSDVGSV